jgi:hypothetical protein
MFSKTRCPECRNERLMNTNMERHGVPYTTQTEYMRQRVRETKIINIEKFKKEFAENGCTLLTTHYTDNKAPLDYYCSCGAKAQISYNHFSKGQRCSNCRIERTKLTSLERYGVSNYGKTEECKQKIRDTNRNRWGYDYQAQNPEENETLFANALKLKEYLLPSGKIVKVQGYEDVALDLLLQIYDENEIHIGRQNMPEIWYTQNGGGYKRYFPDFFIQRDNLVIEVKSTFTYYLHFKKNDYKRKAGGRMMRVIFLQNYCTLCLMVSMNCMIMLSM